MGACASVQDRAAMERSAEIDRQIEEDSRRFRKECKILLLGEFISTSPEVVLWVALWRYGYIGTGRQRMMDDGDYGSME